MATATEKDFPFSTDQPPSFLGRVESESIQVSNTKNYPSPPRLERGFVWTARILAASVALLCVLVMTGGHILDIPLLRGIFQPDWPQMRPGGAWLLMICAFALLMRCTNTHSRWQSLGQNIAGAVALLVGTVCLDWLLGGWLEINERLEFSQDGQPSLFSLSLRPLSAFTIGSAATAIWLLNQHASDKHYLGDGLVLLSGSVNYMILLGYVISAVDIPKLAVSEHHYLPLYTALGSFLLVIAVLFSRPTQGLMVIFSSPLQGSRLARQWLPVLLFLPPLFLILDLLMEKAGLTNSFTGKQIILTLQAASLAILAMVSAAILNRSDSQRRKAMRELRSAHATLEERVRVRTNELDNINLRLQNEVAEKRSLAERYHSLLNNLPLSVTRYVPHPLGGGALVEFNPSARALFDAESTEELLGVNTRDLTQDPQEEIRFNEALAIHGIVRGIELNLKTLRGRPFIAAVTAYMIKDKNGMVYCDCVLEDVTERKAAEQRINDLNASLSQHSAELQSANQELEAFSYSVSHDLRAPLRAIDGFSQIILEDHSSALDGAGQGYLRRVRAAAQHMSNLIDDLLRLSRITGSELIIASVDLSALAQEIVDQLQTAEPNRSVRFTIQPGLTCRGDRSMLRIVLSNLLDNAWKFTASRAPAEIVVGSATREGKSVFYVKDNGVGFNMIHADKLFRAFQRLHDTKEFPGTGIGLATVQRVIHKHGGTVWVEAAINEGATFYFHLPD